MKALLASGMFIALMVTLAACDAAPADMVARPSLATPDMLSQMFDAQDRATAAAENAQRVAATAQRVAAYATTAAQATREYVVLQGQQTRIAQDARATQTVFAGNVQATEIARAANQTRYAEDARATKTTQAQNASATAQAAQYLATAQASNATATAQTIHATATAQAVIVEQTRASASATATAHAANASQTQVAGFAIQTRTSEETQTIITKQTNERNTDFVRSVGMVIGVVLFVVGGLILVGYFAYRVVTVETTRRQREYRDANGELVLELANGDVARADRMPGAFLVTDPQRALPPGTVDADTTRRAQAVSLLLAAQDKATVNEVATALEADGETPALPEPAQPVPGSFAIYKPFEQRPLALDKQPSRLALPIGVTERGADMWISLGEMTHALVGGPTGMGKSNWLHGAIQSLARGGQVDLALHDGKQGSQFARYAGARVQVLADDESLAPFLSDVIGDMRERFATMNTAGASDITEYNRGRDGDRMTTRVIVVDELFDALMLDGVEQSLAELARKGRAAGIHLIMSAQLSDAESVPRQLRANTTLRVAFACVSHSDSQSILGRSGAEKIEKVPGRLLVLWKSELVQAQAFRATLPQAITAGAVRQLPPPSSGFDDMTRRIVEFALREGSGLFVVTRIARELGLRPQEVNRVALDLERKGLLSNVEKDDSGQNRGRRILPALGKVVGNVAA